MKKKLLLIISLLSVSVLVGCAGGGGEMDILPFLQNPIVMVVAGVIIAYWMFKHHK